MSITLREKGEKTKPESPSEQWKHSQMTRSPFHQTVPTHTYTQFPQSKAGSYGKIKGMKLLLWPRVLSLGSLYKRSSSDQLLSRALSLPQVLFQPELIHQNLQGWGKKFPPW